MYYLLVIGATAMFGVQFLFNGKYQEKAGSSVRSSMVLSLITGIVGTIALIIINGWNITLTPFTVFMAIVCALNALLFNFCSIFALKHINVSIYSLFSMIGGMTLPFVAGICFFNEGITIAKVLCLITISVGLSFTVQKGDKKSGRFFYIGVFFFNGMGALLSVLYNKASFEKGAPADYSIASAICKVLLSAIVLFILKLIDRKKASHDKSVASSAIIITLIFAAICGLFNSLANFILLIALDYIPASMQYLLVTGGVVTFSTLFGFFTGKKPKKNDIIAVGISILGMLMLLLPI